MYPLLLCSIVSIAVIIERVWMLTRAARAAARLHQLVTEATQEGGYQRRVGAQPARHLAARRGVQSGLEHPRRRRHAPDASRTAPALRNGAAPEALRVAARDGGQPGAVHRVVRHRDRHHPRFREHGGDRFRRLRRGGRRHLRSADRHRRRLARRRSVDLRLQRVHGAHRQSVRAVARVDRRDADASSPSRARAKGASPVSFSPAENEAIRTAATSSPKSTSRR